MFNKKVKNRFFKFLIHLVIAVFIVFLLIKLENYKDSSFYFIAAAILFISFWLEAFNAILQFYYDLYDIELESDSIIMAKVASPKIRIYHDAIIDVIEVSSNKPLDYIFGRRYFKIFTIAKTFKVYEADITNYQELYQKLKKVVQK